MKRIIFLLAALFTCLLGTSVYAASPAYEARGIMFLPLEETFTGLGFTVEPNKGGGAVFMEDAEGRYIIQLHGYSISKYAYDTDKNQSYTPDAAPQKIGELYFMPLNVMRDCFEVEPTINETARTVTLTRHGKSFTLPYKTTTYEEIKRANKMNMPPNEIIKTAPAPQNGYLIDGVTYAPIRYTFESLGYEVEYDSNTSTIYLYNSEYTYEVCIGAKLIIRRDTNTGNQTYTPEYAPKMIGDSYYLPLRVMSEVLQADISWDQNTKTAHIAKSGKDCYVKCYVYTEEPQQPQSSGGSRRVRTGYIFLPNGQVIIVQTH